MFLLVSILPNLFALSAALIQEPSPSWLRKLIQPLHLNVHTCMHTNSTHTAPGTAAAE